MLHFIRRFFSFLKYNPNKGLYLAVLFLSARNRFRMRMLPIKYLKRTMGILNQESSETETDEIYRQAARIAYVVNRVCDRTPWESKCLVKALTAQHLLRRMKVPSTLYLGVGKDGDDMTAHAWLRTGEYYLTGGKGEGFALVAKFRT